MARSWVPVREKRAGGLQRNISARPRPPGVRIGRVVFGRVVHNWDLSTKRTLLQKAYRALPGGGAVLVHDTLIDDGRRSCPMGLLSSLNMLVWTSAGFGYSAADCAQWMHEAGFRRTRVEPLAIGQSMIIGTR